MESEAEVDRYARVSSTCLDSAPITQWGGTPGLSLGQGPAENGGVSGLSLRMSYFYKSNQNWFSLFTFVHSTNSHSTIGNPSKIGPSVIRTYFSCFYLPNHFLKFVLFGSFLVSKHAVYTTLYQLSYFFYFSIS